LFDLVGCCCWLFWVCLLWLVGWLVGLWRCLVGLLVGCRLVGVITLRLFVLRCCLLGTLLLVRCVVVVITLRDLVGWFGWLWLVVGFDCCCCYSLLLMRALVYYRCYIVCQLLLLILLELLPLRYCCLGIDWYY